MAEPWPWLAIAGLGALHGLSPANGWMLAAACGVHARDEAHALRALAPIALGQAASMAVLGWAVSQGLSVDRGLMRDLAGALLIAAASALAMRRTLPPIRIGARARDVAIALWSFLAASAQSAGLMLVPALLPLCAGDAARVGLTVPGSSPLALAIAVVAVHTTAMLCVTGLVATGVCRGVGVHRFALPRAGGRWLCAATLAVASAALMALPG